MDEDSYHQGYADCRKHVEKILFALAVWFRTPGNINPDDACDECARTVYNLAVQVHNGASLGILEPKVK
jgi:hypothetical protein